MKKLKKFKESLSRNEMRSISGGDENEKKFIGGGGYCGGVCAPGTHCSSSGMQSCGCDYDVNNPLVTHGFCVSHG